MTETTNNSSLRYSFSLVWLVFFAPIVGMLLKGWESDFDLSEDDIKIINSYKKAWYFVWLLIALIITAFVLYLKLNIGLILYIAYTLIIIVVLYMWYNIYLIFANKWALLFSWEDIKKIEVNSIKSWNADYILLYLPFLNEYLFQNKKYTKEQEYWIKESIFFYFLLAITWVLALFFPNLLGLFYIIVLFLILRSVSLFFWVDFVPDTIKSIIYNSFSKRSIELFAYFCALIHFIFQNIFLLIKWKKTYEFGFYLHKTKEILTTEYELNSILKKPKKYLSIIISYLLVIAIFGYLFYKAFYSFYPYIYLGSTILLLEFVFLNVFLQKKLYKLPILTELTSKIVNLFK